MSDRYDVIVVGAGVSGLTAASLLSKHGLRVAVLERLERLGGCCSNYDVNGFRPEVGAIFVIGHEFYYKLFELLDLRLEDYLDWKVIDPVYHVYFEDGSAYPLPRDIDAMAEVVRSISPGDVDGYYRYCREMGKLFDAYLAFVRRPLPALQDLTKITSLARLAANRELLYALPVNLKLLFRNMDRCVRDYFRHPRLQLMFGWENLYAGLPAHRCTGLFTMMAHMGRMGYYYPRGGMIAIPTALARIAEGFGAEVRLGAEVESLIIKGGEARGVRLTDGTALTSRAVVSTAHSRVTYLKLVGEENLPSWAARTVRRQPCSIPAPLIHMGLSRKLEGIRAHMSLVANPREQVDNIWVDYYDRGLLYRPADGAYLLVCPTFDDPGLAPEGKDVLSVFYIAPYRLRYHDWDRIAEEWAWEVVRFLDGRCLPGLADAVEWLDSVPPTELERRLNVAEGAFFGIEMSLTNLGPFRPNYRSRLVPRLYLAGQCTNPGLGVPGAMISGVADAAVILNDWNRRLR
ncbi:phytoene desaturase family protein [Candidatus Solincola tengchongensis]|uniref:phytoene desaturase family protein n=1 Tax=Candidatus Solincola tengchongensis TaxID=2900693 RepID=UPI00257BB04B|nr:phytoene desaturase family protein [Candidatus Solincola tengchongensis]